MDTRARPELSPNAELVRRRLGGVPYVGPEPKLAHLTDSELGELAGLAWHPRQNASDAWIRELRELLRARFPSFDASSAAAALEALLAQAQALDMEFSGWLVQAAARVVEGCSEPAAPGVQSILSSLLELQGPDEPDAVLLALQSCAGRALPEPPDPFVAREQRFLETLERLADRIALGRLCSTWAFATRDDELTPRGADPLALLPGYLACAERLLADALDHVRGIHEGRVPYRADEAFSVEAAQVLRRAALAGLDQDAPFAERTLVALIHGVSLAPDPAHKTVPSQSASIALAKAIAERPSPALVERFRASVRALRHAGLKKKLDSLLKTAERRLVDREDFLSELDPARPLPKGLSRMVIRGFEALLLRPAPLSRDDWFARILENPQTSKTAAALLWRFDDGRTGLPVFAGDRWSLLDVHGEPFEPASEGVRLWHSQQPNADAEGWRQLVIARRLRQPFNQAFRETYSGASLGLLTAPELDVHSLLGLARARGWVLRHGGRLVRRLGPYRVELDVGPVFPGATGATRCFGISFFQGAASAALDPSETDPQGFSECVREVDLLVSVAASAVDPGLAHDTASVRSRRAALVRMLGETPEAQRPFVDGRYVRLGDLAIHIATGRVSRNGEECEPVFKSSKVSVLPYPDKTLELIVAALEQHGRARTR